MKSVYIYFDEGVNTSGVRHLVYSLSLIVSPDVDIKTIDHIGIINGKWMEDSILLIIPGGRDRPYQEHLAGTGISNIQSYVHAGGNYLGICAGAYFGCKEIVFEKGSSLEIEEKRDLGFFPGKAIGTVYPDKTFSYFLTTGMKASHIQYKQESLYVYYNGGCHFLPEDNEFQSLGTYLDTTFTPPYAIVKTKVGKGHAILSGVHLEYSTTLIPNNFIPKEEFKKLLLSEKQRITIFKDLFSEFNLHI